MYVNLPETHHKHMSVHLQVFLGCLVAQWGPEGLALLLILVIPNKNRQSFKIDYL